MKPTTSALAAHLKGEVATLATCWLLERADGWVRCFTDHEGGLVGAGGVGRMVPAGIFATAPRFHDGAYLKPDEGEERFAQRTKSASGAFRAMNAILQCGERVLNRKEARA